MTIRTNLKDLLRRLELIELGKPQSQRREIPTVTELAELVGMSRVAVSNYTNDNRRRVDLDTLAAIANVLRERGFEFDEKDLFVWEPVIEGEFVPAGVAGAGV